MELEDDDTRSWSEFSSNSSSGSDEGDEEGDLENGQFEVLEGNNRDGDDGDDDDDDDDGDDDGRLGKVGLKQQQQQQQQQQVGNKRKFDNYDLGGPNDDRPPQPSHSGAVAVNQHLQPPDTRFEYRIPGEPVVASVEGPAPDWDTFIKSGAWATDVDDAEHGSAMSTTRMLRHKFRVDFPKPTTVPVPPQNTPMELIFVDVMPIQIAVYANNSISLLKKGDVDTHEQSSSTLLGTIWDTASEWWGSRSNKSADADASKKPVAATPTAATTTEPATFYLSFSCLFDATHVLNMSEEEVVHFFTDETHHKNVMTHHIHSNRSRPVVLYGDALKDDVLLVQRIVQHNLRLFVTRMFPTQGFRSLPVSTYSSTVLREASPVLEPAMRTQLNTFATYQKRYFIRQAVIVDDIYKNPLMRFVKDQFAQTAQKISTRNNEPWSIPLASSFREVDWIDRYITTRYRTFFKEVGNETAAEIREEFKWAERDKAADPDGDSVDATLRYLRLFPVVPPDMLSHRGKHLWKNTWVRSSGSGSSSSSSSSASAIVTPLDTMKQFIERKVTRPASVYTLLHDFAPLRDVSGLLGLLGDADVRYFNAPFRQMCSSIGRFSMSDFAKIDKNTREVKLFTFENDFLSLLLTLNFLLYESHPAFRSLVRRYAAEGGEGRVNAAKAGSLVVSRPEWLLREDVQRYFRHHVCYFPFAPNLGAANEPLVLTLQLDLMDSVTVPRMCSLSRAAFSNHLLYDDARIRLYPLDFMFRAQVYGATGSSSSSSSAASSAAAVATGTSSSSSSSSSSTDWLLRRAIADARASGLRSKAMEMLAAGADGNSSALNAQTVQKLISEFLQLLNIRLSGLQAKTLQKTQGATSSHSLKTYKLFGNGSGSSSSSSSGADWYNSGRDSSRFGSSYSYLLDDSSRSKDDRKRKELEEKKTAEAYKFLYENVRALRPYLSDVLRIDDKTGMVRRASPFSVAQQPVTKSLEKLDALPSTSAADSIGRLGSALEGMTKDVEDMLAKAMDSQTTLFGELQSVVKTVLDHGTKVGVPDTIALLVSKEDSTAKRAFLEFSKLQNEYTTRPMDAVLYLLSVTIELRDVNVGPLQKSIQLLCKVCAFNTVSFILHGARSTSTAVTSLRRPVAETITELAGQVKELTKVAQESFKEAKSEETKAKMAIALGMATVAVLLDDFVHNAPKHLR